MSCGICPSLSELLCLAWQSLGPPMLLQIALFHSFHGWVMFHCMYAPHRYPFLCRWTFRLLPCLGCCKQCCNELWGACILLVHVFLWIYAGHPFSKGSVVSSSLGWGSELFPPPPVEGARAVRYKHSGARCRGNVRVGEVPARLGQVKCNKGNQSYFHTIWSSR